MSLSKENYIVRAADSFEKEAFDLPEKKARASSPPEKSKYYELWSEIQDLLIQGEDAVVESEELDYYDMINIIRGLKGLAKSLKKQGRIDFEIVVNRLDIREVSGTIDGTNEPVFNQRSQLLQIRAIFPD
jgi:hypothetical protein